MWERKELKKKAKKVVMSNYWVAIIVCFIIAILTGEFGTSVLKISQSEDSIDPNYIVNQISLVINKEQNNIIKQENNIEVNNEQKFSLNNIFLDLSQPQTQLYKAIEANLNSVTKSQKYIFRIWDAIKAFNMEQRALGIFLCFLSLLALIFTIFFADPLIVGGKRYFLKARINSNTKINVMIEIFKNGNWLNIVFIMFLRNLYNLLWYLTIIGGVIKTYEYRMIPFILAEKPNIKKKEAFKLSKQMMYGNKWRMFVLDISFFGWYCLSVLTFGILSVLYVNPYNTATTVELYTILRDKVISEKCEYYESLNESEIS